MPRHISQQAVSPAEGQTLFKWLPQSKSSVHTHTHILPSGTYTHAMLHMKLYALLNTRIQNSNVTSVRTSDLNVASDFDLAILIIFKCLCTFTYSCIHTVLSGICLPRVLFWVFYWNVSFVLLKFILIKPCLETWNTYKIYHKCVEVIILVVTEIKQQHLLIHF